jgi:hypothetical protein
LLFAGTSFYINGDAITVARADRTRMRQLADRRAFESSREWSPAGVALLHEWYLCGFLVL